MKKILASTLLVLFATSALAAESAYVLQPFYSNRGEFTEPCQTEAPVPANGLCGDGRVCPVGYDPVRKVCWSRGGLRDCGITCQNNHMYDN